MQKMSLTLTSAGFATLLLLGATSSPAQAFSLTQSNPLKIMPLGDSNTRGKGEDIAGYRDDLWMLLNDSGFNVDFVGSATTNPSNSWNENYAFDRDHQGHGGYAISGDTFPGASDLMSNIDNWLNAATPDVILLMAGTNDFIFQNTTTAQETIDELGTLIDKIFAWSSDVNLLVSSIAPLAPDRGLEQEAALYNEMIPGLLGSDRYQQKNLSFVDTRNLLTLDDLYDGVHFTPEGYSTLANAWFDGIVSASDLGHQGPIAGEPPGSDDSVSIPEPTSVLGILAFGLVGAGSLRKRRHVSP